MKFLAKPLPAVTYATLVASLIAGVLAVLNQTTFVLQNPWHEIVTYGLIFLAGFGITPLIGSAFQNAIHLPHVVTAGITSALVVLQGILSTVSLNGSVHAIIAGVIVVLAGLGFGTGPATVAVKRGTTASK